LTITDRRESIANPFRGRSETMAPDDAQDTSGGSAEGADRPQDPIVDRLRREPAQRPEAAVRMSGFLADSDRPGFRRLYFTRDLDYYADFHVEDAIHIETVPAEERPFRGDQATRLTLPRDAIVEYGRTHTAQEVDDFDLDVQLRRRPGRTPPVIARLFGCPTDDTCQTQCDQPTCNTCETQCDQPTCNTCLSKCVFCPPPRTGGGDTCFTPTKCIPEACFVPR
jgi:hypothetical protein